MIRPHDVEDLSDEDEEEDEDDGPRSDYQWCMHCERAYKRGEHRMVVDIAMCPYPGCGGDVFSDGWDWDRFREPLPQYPAVPEFGVKYPMYPPKKTAPEPIKSVSVPQLTHEARRILEYLVSKMRLGRFNPSDEGSFCGYKEVHTALGLDKKGPQWGKSLENQGMAALAKWILANKLPAITGLIVAEQEPRLPGKGFYDVNGIPDNSTEWWRNQIRAAILHDWSPWVPDLESVSFADLVADARAHIDGASALVTREVKIRCDALRQAAKVLFRGPDGLIRCKICDWHKPAHGMISGDIVELHHLDPISEAPDEGRIVTVADAVTLFVPLCPNCHRMIHARTGSGHFDIETLRGILKK